jgi:acyl-CoA synthetase (AMP-forming)/AMP-acid ligase II
MYPGTHAKAGPDKPALIMGRSGEVVTYAELDRRSSRLAQLFSAQGLRPGGHVAIFMENNPRYPEVYWAVIRSGLYLTTVSRHLSADEAAFIIDDCGAEALVTSRALADVATRLLPSIPKCRLRLMADGAAGGYQAYEEAIASQPAEPLATQPMGATMLYSSGTTGRPKGVRRPLSGRSVEEGDPTILLLAALFGFDAETVYLSPAPIYHSAPLSFSMALQSLGATVVMMEHFDPREALRCVEAHCCNHSQWVPTMFTRMLKLPEAERRRFELSSLRRAIHAAAPCPVPVKEEMIGWWGPILQEYYGGTELNGLTLIDSEDWLEHRGSVGRAVLGTLHICDDAGAELPPGETGVIYFEREQMPFEYHNDPERTRDSQHPRHPNWSTLGDMGRLDQDGYLYLTDRKDYMIVSGGVNIYPAEIENALVTHPKVIDVAVFGIPNEEFGEEVKAVVQPIDGVSGSPELEQELLGFIREKLAHYKCPRSIDFESELPRLDTGKLYKRLLRDPYWSGHDTRIV